MNHSNQSTANKCSLLCEPWTSTATLVKSPDELPTVAPAMIVFRRAASKQEAVGTFNRRNKHNGLSTSDIHQNISDSPTFPVHGQPTKSRTCQFYQSKCFHGLLTWLTPCALAPP